MARRVQGRQRWSSASVSGCAVRGEVVGDGAIVSRAVVEARGRQLLAQGGTDGAVVGAHVGQYLVVVGRVDRQRDAGVILGGGAQHGRAADVDVLDRGGMVAVWRGDGLLERGEIVHHKINWVDAVLDIAGGDGSASRQVA